MSNEILIAIGLTTLCNWLIIIAMREWNSQSNKHQLKLLKANKS